MRQNQTEHTCRLIALIAKNKRTPISKGIRIMRQNQTHSPTPWDGWQQEEEEQIRDANGNVVVSVFGYNGEANAHYIVAAVNSHAELVAACNAVLTDWHSKPRNMDKKEPAYLQQCRDALYYIHNPKPKG